MTSKIILILSSALLLAVITLSIILSPGIPIYGFEKLQEYKFENINKTLTVLDKNGKIIGDKIYDQNKIFVELKNLPDHVYNSFIAIEDKRFFRHDGIDLYRIVGATKNNILALRFKEGASTITQQLIKNTHLNNQKTLKRKFNEIKLARELESKYSKEKILEMYLNVLYFGNNVYGLGGASKVYFNKSAEKLTLSESATLAGMINNPLRYGLYENKENAIKRRNVVLKRMLEQDMISESDYFAALNENVTVEKNGNRKNQFVMNVINEAKNVLNLSEKQLFSGNYTVYSRYDADLQDKVNEIINGLTADGVTICVTVCENKNGNIIAKCSNSNKDLTNVRRSPGSTIKPILCYAPALEKKLIYPASPIKDEKVDYFGYSPTNHDKRYHGWITCEEAIVKSYNVPAVKMLNMTGVEYSKDIAQKCGLTFSKNDTSLALALGGLERGVTLDEICECYSTIARLGNHVNLGYVTSIYDNNGICVYSADKSNTVALGDDVATLVTCALNKCAADGTAKRLCKFSHNVAAKTGTVGSVQGNTDAYCVAYTPNFTVAVWVGVFDGELMPNEISGSTLPSDITYKVLSVLNDNDKIAMSDIVLKIGINGKELDENHKIVLADATTPPKDINNFYFSKNNMPYVYWEDVRHGRLEEFDNFEIIDSFVD